MDQDFREIDERLNKNRLENFRQAKDHPHYRKLLAKLKSNDIDFIENWIMERAHLDYPSFEGEVNRIFLDKPELRAQFPKYGLIQEMIGYSNKNPQFYMGRYARDYETKS